VPLLLFLVVAIAASGGVDLGDLDDLSGLPELGLPLLFIVVTLVNGFGEEGGGGARIPLLPEAVRARVGEPGGHGDLGQPETADG
jgi:hypothetical protein